MSTTKIHVVQGMHPTIPGNPMSAHLTRHEADKAAFDLVVLIANEIDEAPKPPSNVTMWQAYLTDIQRLILAEAGVGLTGEEDACDMAHLSGSNVEILVLDVPKPRIVVTMQDDAIDSIAGDIDVELHVVDHYVEGMTSNETILVPSAAGGMKKAHVQRLDVDTRPDWIDAVMKACTGNLE